VNGSLPITCGIRLAADGTKVLGAPLGTASYQAERARKRLRSSLDQVALLPELDFGDAMLILRKSIVPRARYLAGVLPPSVMAEAAAEWDAAIESCLTRMFKSAPHPRCFPSGPGCLGISKMVDELALDRVNGWARAKEVVEQHFPRLAHLTVIPADTAAAAAVAAITHPVHVEVVSAWRPLPAAVRAADGVFSPLESPSPNTASPPSTKDKAAVENPRRKLSKAFSKHLRTTVRRSLDPLGQALFDASASPGARAWADATPLPWVPNLGGDRMRVAHGLWFGAPIPELAGEQDPMGRARLRRDASGRVVLHIGLVSGVGDLLVDSGFRVWTEVKGIYGAFPDSMPAAARRGVANGADRRTGPGCG
jgi:hypothetical protein